ncbi:pancreatic lipase-related protein 3 [Caerostris extrusa]|uniref:Pancreatic lipase-related protein 3 n=1 Tax=Caerostris extrusa TaxID=172846 RepID=A0AAV4QGA2_CAEEX|nr:pancreatic lipase-related protein 3 [Caerostris extrusa]
MKTFSLGLLCLWIVSAVGNTKIDITKRDVSSFFTREKCIDGLGRSRSHQHYFRTLHSGLPQYTQQFQQHGRQLGSSSKQFIQSPPRHQIHCSRLHKQGGSSLEDAFKDALLFYEACNVFYVDWSGGDGSLYEQAVANTRVVGAEIAAFIKELQKRTGITPESVHIIGHSLGAHIAGYAGKRLTTLGRISAMDPAGPYFTNVEAIVRLDRADALFVDAIHTNAAPSRFQGFGLVDSIAHFDFYPNGGHLQPGCQDMGQAILSFLGHPTFDADGLHDIMCNHGRATDLFISSIKDHHCQLLGSHCDSWQSYVDGKCGNCSSEQALCVPLGMNSIRFSKNIVLDKSLNFYLKTTADEPYC